MSGVRMRSQEDRAWSRGYRWAMQNGYGYEDDGEDSRARDAAISLSVRDCRIIAMAYAMGWKNGRKSAQANRKGR